MNKRYFSKESLLDYEIHGPEGIRTLDRPVMSRAL